MTALPSDYRIEVNKLAGCFNKTSATYKFYWLLSIIELIDEQKTSTLSLRDILIRMISNAWYSVHYFRLSFGPQDKLSEHIVRTQSISAIPIDENKATLILKLSNNNNPQIELLIQHFRNLVPFHFLSPWVKGSRAKVINFSNEDKGCIYQIDWQRKLIVINDLWYQYLLEHKKIVEDFCFWNLCRYLQNKNPNVPNIPNKLIRPDSRASLSKQKRIWNLVISSEKEFKCIYSGENLSNNSHHLEHFIPWSFVVHDLMWNLVPIHPIANIRKRNLLPALEYLQPFVRMQKKAIRKIYNLNPSNKLLEDYLVLGNIDELINMEESLLLDRYSKIVNPLIQSAINMGYQFWEV